LTGYPNERSLSGLDNSRLGRRRRRLAVTPWGILLNAQVSARPQLPCADELRSSATAVRYAARCSARTAEGIRAARTATLGFDMYVLVTWARR